MGKPPVVIPVSELRRDTAQLIEVAYRSHEPLFITQRGYVTAVLLSREEYGTMCVLRDKGLQAINPQAVIVERMQDELDLGPTSGYWDD
jgi:prevent-host-death family protein